LQLQRFGALQALTVAIAKPDIFWALLVVDLGVAQTLAVITMRQASLCPVNADLYNDM
jgi:hypothetical protein